MASKQIFVKLQVVDAANEIFSEASGAHRSKNPVVRAIIDNGGHVSLVRKFDRGPDQSVFGSIVGVDGDEEAVNKIASVLSGTPGVVKTGNSVQALTP